MYVCMDGGRGGGYDEPCWKLVCVHHLRNDSFIKSIKGKRLTVLLLLFFAKYYLFGILLNEFYANCKR